MAPAYVTEESTRVANITLLVIASLIASLRLLVSFLSAKTFRWDDGWLTLAFVLYIALSAIYLVATPLFSRFASVVSGQIPPYPGFTADERLVRIYIFPATSLLWLILWSIKFSLLAFYKQLMIRLTGYIRLWWAVVVICCVCLLGCIFSHIFACGGNVAATFTPGECEGPSAITGIKTSLWLAYGADILTDLLIMALPIGLIRKARMPLRQKVSIGGLFCLGLVCVAVATIRVREVGRTIGDTSAPSVTWLAIWGIVESSIAVIIGCAPGVYREIKNFAKSDHRYYGGSAGYSHGSSRARDVESGDVQLSDLNSKSRAIPFGNGSARHLHDSGSSSQEELAKSPAMDERTITVTRSTMVRTDDPLTTTSWDRRIFPSRSRL